MAPRPGDATKQAEFIEKFHNDVNRLARLMAIEHGLDPDAVTNCRYNEHQTPYELRTAKYIDGTWDESPVLVKRWETFRSDAACLLAGQRALNGFFLTSE